MATGGEKATHTGTCLSSLATCTFYAEKLSCLTSPLSVSISIANMNTFKRQTTCIINTVAQFVLLSVVLVENLISTTVSELYQLNKSDL